MPELEPPTPGARRMVASRRKFFLAAGVMLGLAAASVAWWIASSNVGALLLFPVFLGVAVFLVMLPVMTGLYARDYDTRGYVRTSVVAWPAIGQIVVGVAMAATQISGELDRNAIALVVCGGLLALVGVAQLISVLRMRDKREFANGQGEDQP